MSFIDKIIKRHTKENALEAVDIVASISTLADNLRVDGEERIRMFKRGLVNYPDLVAALPAVEEEEDLFISLPKPIAECSLDAVKNDNKPLFRYTPELLSYFLNYIDSLPDSDKGNDTLFASFGHCSKYHDVEVMNRVCKFSVTDLIAAAKKLGYFTGKLDGYSGKLLTVTNTGSKYFTIDDRYIKWNYDKFIAIYKELGEWIIKTRIEI